jgi:hypothetical protein
MLAMAALPASVIAEARSTNLRIIVPSSENL